MYHVSGQGIDKHMINVHYYYYYYYSEVHIARLGERHKIIQRKTYNYSHSQPERSPDKSLCLSILRA